MVEIEDLDKICEKVMRQTNYDKDTAAKMLEMHNYDIVAVIRDYLKPPPKIVVEPTTLNQRIYKEIRTFMDSTPQSLSPKRN